MRERDDFGMERLLRDPALAQKMERDRLDQGQAAQPLGAWNASRSATAPP